MSDEARHSTWVVVPAFNEAETVGQVLDDLLAAGYPVIVVDDGSTDETPRLAAERSVHLLRHVVNLGQGAALQTGIAYALRHCFNVRHIVTFDADGQHRVEDIPALLAPLLGEDFEAALGTRWRLPADNPRLPWSRRLWLKLAVYFTRVTTRLHISDTHNGLRAFSREAAEKLSICQNRMTHASEILDIIADKKMRYTEVDVQIQYSQYSLKKGQRLSNSLNILWEWVLGKVR